MGTEEQVTLSGGDSSVQMGHMCSLAWGREGGRWEEHEVPTSGRLNGGCGTDLSLALSLLTTLSLGGHGLRRKEKALLCICDIGFLSAGPEARGMDSPV